MKTHYFIFQIRNVRAEMSGIDEMVVFMSRKNKFGNYVCHISEKQRIFIKYFEATFVSTIVLNKPFSKVICHVRGIYFLHDLSLVNIIFFRQFQNFAVSPRLESLFNHFVLCFFFITKWTWSSYFLSQLIHIISFLLSFPLSFL